MRTGPGCGIRRSRVITRTRRRRILRCRGSLPGSRRIAERLRGERGQATVEAAFALPVLFLLALLLLQPGILLYDRMVMEAAAAEGCRLLATRSDAMGDAETLCEEYVLRRLGSVPSAACFHVHEGGCTWRVEMSGDERSDRVAVRVSTEVRPLPLLDMGAALLGLVNERGNLVVEVTAEAPTRAPWAQRSLGGVSPEEKAGAWCDED